MKVFKSFFLVCVAFMNVMLFADHSPVAQDTRLVSLSQTLSKLTEDYQGANIDDYMLIQVIDENARNFDDACAYEPDAIFRPLAIYNHRQGGYNATTDSTPNDFRMDGVTTGMEFAPVKMFTIGAAYGYTNSTITADNNWGNIKGNSHSAIGFFRLGCLGPFNFDGRYDATWTWFDNNRLARNGSRSKASYMGVEQGADLRMICVARYQGFQFFPSLGVRYVNIQVESYNETGDDGQKLSYKGDIANQVYSDIGVTISHPLACGQTVKVTPMVGAYWMHQYLDDERVTLTSMYPDYRNPTLVTLEPSERNAGKVNLGLIVSNGASVEGFINLDTIFSSTSRFTWDTRAGLKFAF